MVVDHVSFCGLYGSQAAVVLSLLSLVRSFVMFLKVSPCGSHWVNYCVLSPDVELDAARGGTGGYGDDDGMTRRAASEGEGGRGDCARGPPCSGMPKPFCIACCLVYRGLGPSGRWRVRLTPYSLLASWTKPPEPLHCSHGEPPSCLLFVLEMRAHRSPSNGLGWSSDFQRRCQTQCGPIQSDVRTMSALARCHTRRSMTGTAWWDVHATLVAHSTCNAMSATAPADDTQTGYLQWNMLPWRGRTGAAAGISSRGRMFLCKQNHCPSKMMRQRPTAVDARL